MRKVVLLPFACVLAALFTACSSSSDGGTGETCTDYVVPTAFDPQTPKVTYRADVVPIFKRSCTFSSCHGSTSNPNGVFLGKPGADDASTVVMGLVGRKAPELPTMNLVTAGDPRASYLMHKIDGSQCTLNAQCTDGSCQSSMPKDSDLIELELRDKVRRWIAQGAKDD